MALHVLADQWVACLQDKTLFACGRALIRCLYDSRLLLTITRHLPKVDSMTEHLTNS